jgi:predicted component of type VI protein secretion system
VRAGMALLLQQVTALRAALSKLSTRLDGSADDPEAIAAITLKRNTLLQELGSIEQQFSALRTKSA